MVAIVTALKNHVAVCIYLSMVSVLKSPNIITPIFKIGSNSKKISVYLHIQILYISFWVIVYC